MTIDFTAAELQKAWDYRNTAYTMIRGMEQEQKSVPQATCRNESVQHCEGHLPNDRYFIKSSCRREKK